jgi:hypothetical protein
MNIIKIHKTNIYNNNKKRKNIKHKRKYLKVEKDQDKESSKIYKLMIFLILKNYKIKKISNKIKKISNKLIKLTKILKLIS